jgi:hypothetical protein
MQKPSISGEPLMTARRHNKSMKIGDWNVGSIRPPGSAGILPAFIDLNPPPQAGCLRSQGAIFWRDVLAPALCVAGKDYSAGPGGIGGAPARPGFGSASASSSRGRDVVFCEVPISADDKLKQHC